MVDNQTKMDSIRDSYESFCGLCDPNLLETLRERVEDLTQEWQRIEERLKNKIVSLKVLLLSFLMSGLCPLIHLTSLLIDKINASTKVVVSA